MGPSLSSIKLAAAYVSLGVYVVGIAAAQGPQPPVPLPAASAEQREEIFQLAFEKRKFIWDAEHVTFKIETHVGKPLVRALLGGDEQRPLVFFREGLTGAVLQAGGGTTRHAVTVSEVRRVAGEVAHKRVDLRGLVRYLVDSLSWLREPSRSRLRVISIEQDPDDPQRWPTRLLLEAAGRDAAGTLRELEAEYRVDFRFASPEEITPQGRTITRFDVLSEIRRTSKRRLMHEVTEEAGLAALGLPDNWDLEPGGTREFRYQIAVEDFDRDGYLDIAVASIEGRALLLRSIGGRRFENVAGALGIQPPATSPRKLIRHSLAAWIDYDGDGYPDLILGERLFHNEQGRRFVDVTARSGLTVDRVPLGASVADYDRDGDLDLYIVYLKRRRQRAPGSRPWVGDVESGGLNALWRNEGEGRFRDVTAESKSGARSRQSFAAAFFHYDDDLYPDLYVANDFGKNVLLRNLGNGRFEEITDAVGAGDYATSMGVSAGDLDNDGTPEIYVANMFSKMGRRIIAQVGEQDYPPGVYPQILGSCAGNRLYRKDGASYREVGQLVGVNEVGWAYAPAMVDMDGDGLLDLYATTGFMSFDRHQPDG